MLYEYDTDGFLVGWHSDAYRPLSTTTAPTVPPNRARWNGTEWIEDGSREVAAQVALQRQAIAAELQRQLDTLAISWGYDSMMSLATYLGSTVPSFAAEALAATAWRDAVWVYAATSTATSVEDFFAGVPPTPAHP